MRRAVPAIVVTLLGLGALAAFKSTPGARRATARVGAATNDVDGAARDRSPASAATARRRPRRRRARRTTAPRSPARPRAPQDLRRRPRRQPVRHRASPRHGAGRPDHRRATAADAVRPRAARSTSASRPSRTCSQEALQAQSANIQIVSGATYTSESYAQSLQSALDKAQRLTAHSRREARRRPVGHHDQHRRTRPRWRQPSLDDCFAWFQRVDELFSTWRDDTEIMRIGRGELAADDASDEVRTVLDLAEHLRLESNGAFDITAGSRAKVPPRPGLAPLDPSGIVKGWAVERAAEMLAAAGASCFFINAGGDVVVRGRPDDAPRWLAGRHPTSVGTRIGRGGARGRRSRRRHLRPLRTR